MGETPARVILDNRTARSLRGHARPALEAMRRRANTSPRRTMDRTELHPADALLLLALAVLWAVAVLARAVLVPLVALLLTVAGWRPGALAPAAAAPVAAAEPPLAPVAEPIAEALVPLTVAELRRRARAAGLPRALSRSGRRADLLEALVALEGAACG